MSKTTRHPEVTVKRIHFEDFSGPEFERLSFAYLLRAFEWKTIDWYGQLGGDSGRDNIWRCLKCRYEWGAAKR